MADTQSAGQLTAGYAWSGVRRRTWSWKAAWLWLHILLVCATFLTTTVFGFAAAESFQAGIPLNVDWLFDGYVRLAHLDRQLLVGLWFSAPLMAILLAHETGHYVACRVWGVDASLPYFLPSPLLLGTFGAFIRIRAPIYTRQILFDIGASGPFAGFVVLLPFLVTGIRLSRFSHFVALPPDALSFGTPLLMRLTEWMHFGFVNVHDVQLHPMAMAAWAGLLATAMNLLPMGQLDGGHILYAVLGERYHRLIATAAIGALVLLGFAYRTWWVLAVVMFFVGRRHPLVYDPTPLRGWRVALSGAAFVLLVLSFAAIPVSTR